MRKTLLSLALLLASVAASAFTPDIPERIQTPVNDPRFTLVPADIELQNKAKAHARPLADEEDDILSMVYSKAYDPYTAISLNNATASTQVGMAFELTKDDANQFAGNNITAFNFIVGMNKETYKNNFKAGKLFVSTSLDTFQPFYTQDFDPSVFAAGSEASVILDQPYEIEAGTKVYIGVMLTLGNANMCPLWIDYVNHGNDTSGGWFGLYQNGGWVWDNFSARYGFICNSITLEGPSLPTDGVNLIETDIVPVANVNSEFGVDTYIHFLSCRPVKTMEIECTVGDNPAETIPVAFETPITYDQAGWISLSGLTYDKPSTDGIPVKVRVSKVNGVDNTYEESPEITKNVIILAEGKGYKRNVVMEEITGTWCQYCPLGWTTMEKIHENHTDGSIIPVCIHVDDPMVSASYQNVVPQGIGVPYGMLNRIYTTTPQSYEETIKSIEYIQTIPAVAQIELVEAKFVDTRKLDITTKYSFAFDHEKAASAYRIAFGFTEDNVGPYEQTNAYAGGSSGTEWDNQPNPVELMYNDVARQLTSPTGYLNSIPNGIVEGQEYTFTRNVTLNSSISDLSKLNVVVYLMNTKTGEVENAAFMRADKLTTAIEAIGADDVEFGSEAPVEYFNLQGIRVENPTNGIFIRRQGSKSEKVIL
ncbi:MAG: Omp28-related outer membrane protein [Clostridium sp.]|nr:Omp28-related outer membrane protein [Clostridium sp.]